MRRLRPLAFGVAVILYIAAAARFGSAFPLLMFDFRDTLFAYVTLGVILIAIGELGFRLTRRAAFRWPWRVAVVTLLLMLVATEAWLRFGWGAYTTAEERSHGKYRTFYQRIDQMKNDARQQRYFLYPAHLKTTLNFPEFSYELRTNELGMRGPEVDPRPHPDHFRIITIGDSFTEGFGVDEPHSWPAQLAQILDAEPPVKPIELDNAGVAGSDPVFEYMLLHDVLTPMHPDMVIDEISANDLQDVCQRGGFERYQADGSVVLRPRPSWEWIYGLSYIARHVAHDMLHYDGILMSMNARKQCETFGPQVLRDVVDRSCQLARQKGFTLVIAIGPMIYEMQDRQFELEDLWHGSPPPCAHVVWMRKWFDQHGMTRDNLNTYYYQSDRHHNARGNRMFAEGMADYLTSARLLPEPAGAVQRVKDPS